MLLELLPETSLFSIWLIKYGSFALFFLLSLGIIALPVPEETLMVVSGILMHNGKLNIPFTIFFSYAGAITGITMSYFMGRTAGNFLLQRYGMWIGITEARLKKAHYWFERLGKWLLVVGYFIPGIRHLTGFSAGATSMKFSHFALFAYSGAILWVSVFLALGYFVGNYCLALYDQLENIDLILIAAAVALFLVLVYLVKRSIKRAFSRKVVLFKKREK
jgi:membrane protein DedA with SNARE-associated domain